MKSPFPLVVLGLCACAPVAQIEDAPKAETTVAAPPPPANARTVDEFDTTTQAQRATASAPATGGRSLGVTVASLGDPAKPGFWIETPLVEDEGAGRLVYPANGKSVEVELRPGPSSRVSLAALRVLEAPLTELSEIEVFAR